jgi:hypothetical protein
MSDGIRVIRFSSWQPREEEPEPDINFTDPRFRRRLSMISRMTIRVLHDIMPLPPEAKVFFVSFRGEVNQQFRINKMLITDGDILPAAFSLSVFNAPPALASMALQLTAGYTAVYPAEENFHSALSAAAASLAAGGADYTAFVYADETLVPDYRPWEKSPALAFAALLGAEGSAAQAGPRLPSGGDAETPEKFLAALCAYNGRENPDARH